MNALVHIDMRQYFVRVVYVHQSSEFLQNEEKETKETLIRPLKCGPVSRVACVALHVPTHVRRTRKLPPTILTAVPLACWRGREQ